MKDLISDQGIGLTPVGSHKTNPFQENKGKPILCLDFDGVCHSYTSGFQGIDVILDPPVHGLFHFLGMAHNYFELFIYSVRSASETGRNAMRQWFIDELDKFHGDGEHIMSVDWLHFPETKPPAFVSLDDRVLTFNGTWPDIDTLIEFKPWNK